MKKKLLAPTLLLAVIIICSCTKEETAVITEPHTQPQAQSCTTTVSNLFQTARSDSFTFHWSTEIDVDINNDGVNDFRFETNQAGNGITKELVGLVSGNEILIDSFQKAAVLTTGDEVGPSAQYASSFNFNNWGSGSNAYFTDQYLGLKFDAGGDTHYGWLKLTAYTDGGPQSNTPIYYSLLTFELSEQGYDEACYEPVILP